MVKRLRASSPATPDAKRQRTAEEFAAAAEGVTANTPATWDELPFEMVAGIARSMDDPLSFVDTYENLLAFGGIDSRNHKILSWSAESRAAFARDLSRYRQDLRLMCSQVEDGNPGGRVVLDQMPMWRTKDCVKHVKNLVEGKNKPFPLKEFRSVVLNIEHIPPVWRDKVVTSVLAYEKSGEAQGDLVEQLIDKAEFLTPEQHGLLVDATVNKTQEFLQKECLRMWAPKMDLLDADNQKKLLFPANVADGDDGRYADDAQVASRLAIFSKHLDKIPPEQRDLLVHRSIQLGFDHDLKWEILAHLAGHFKNIDPPSGEKLLAHVADNVSRPASYIDGRRWYTQPPFCQVEAVHHLWPHRNESGIDCASKLQKFIDRTINTTDFDSRGAQAQLISHLPDDKRASLPVELIGSGAFNLPVMEGLTVRAADMTADEKSRYLDVVCECFDDVLDDRADEIVDYVCDNGLQHFNEDEAFRIVSKCIHNVTCYTLDSLDGQFFHVSKLDCMKSGRMVDHLVAQTSQIVRSSAVHMGSYEDDDDGLRSIPGHVARCCAKWAAAEIATVISNIGRSGEHPICAPQNTPPEPEVSLPRYDLRPRGEDGRAVRGR